MESKREMDMERVSGGLLGGGSRCMERRDGRVEILDDLVSCGKYLERTGSRVIS